jgi:hypothetical protein
MSSEVKVIFSGNVFCIQRPLWPEEVVAGRANVAVFLDKEGRITAIQIDFVEYGYISEGMIEKKQNILRNARW